MRKLAPWLFFFPILLGVVYLAFYFIGPKVLPEAKIYSYANETLRERLGLEFKYKGFYVHFPKALIFREIEIFHQKTRLLSARELKLNLSYRFNKERPIQPAITLTEVVLSELKTLENTLPKIKLRKKKKVPIDTQANTFFKKINQWLEKPDIFFKKTIIHHRGKKYQLNGSFQDFNQVWLNIDSEYGNIAIRGDIKTKRGSIKSLIQFPLKKGALKIKLSGPFSYTDHLTLSALETELELPEHAYLKYPTRLNSKSDIQLSKKTARGKIEFLPPKEKTGTATLLGSTDFQMPLSTPSLLKLLNAKLELKDWESPYFGASSLMIDGELSLRRQLLQVKAEALQLRLPFFEEDVLFKKIKGVWDNFGARISRSDFVFKNKNFSIDLVSKDIRETLDLNIDGKEFDLSWFGKRTFAKLRALLPTPQVNLNAEISQLRIAGIDAGDVSGKIHATTNVITIHQAKGEIYHTGVELSGKYEVKPKRFNGNYRCPNVLAKTVSLAINEKVNIEGAFALSGEINHSSKQPMRIITDVTNATPSLVLNSTSLQKDIWKLPFISSKKSTQDILQNLNSQVLTTFEAKQVKHEIMSSHADFGEFQVKMTGEIETGADIEKYKINANLDLFFSDYFKDNYINATRTVQFFTSDSLDGFVRPALWEGKVNLIRFVIAQENDAITYKTVKN